ncbi:MAG: tripartite tricarboxylate transporter substrate binding protein [Polaromonas sp.]|nr:tripartite tricarboxylate transporter substrate binding protein [Polaromonas sp.]
MKRRDILIAPAVLGAASMLPLPLIAQQAFPSRPISMVVPFPAGSATDTVARIIAQPLGAALGQAIMVDNRPGADGTIAARLVMRAAPDGHTLLMATATSITGVPALSKEPPYDPVKDFTAITQIGNFSFLLVVNSALRLRTLEQLVAHAKANPGKMTYASGNVTGIVAMSQLAALAGIDLLHIPYKGEPPAMLDLIAGRVDMMFATPTTADGFIREGKILPLATTNKTRLKSQPDIPTIAEAGVKLTFAPWGGMFGPANMPAAISERISREVSAVVRQPAVVEALQKHQLETVTSTPAEFAEFIKRELEIWRKVATDQKLPRS